VLVPRPNRVFVSHRVYHVYNRLGRGERVFEDDGEATSFIRVLREVVERDALTVFAWCLMPNHFHLALRTGTISLDRPLRSLQQRVTRGGNFRQRVFGPLWQGRYKAKLVTDQRYYDQLLSYIHLNPVSAGIVVDPADYRWSGHRELIGKVKTPIVDIDEVLRVFGKTRRAARGAYVRQLKGTVQESWVGDGPGRLPWWRLGRPVKSEDEDPEQVAREKRACAVEEPANRALYEAGDFVAQGAERLGVSLEDPRSRRKGRNLVRARGVIMLLGVEHYALKVKDLAMAMNKSADGMSHALARIAVERSKGDDLRILLDELDQQLANIDT
jgi:putative transposase